MVKPYGILQANVHHKSRKNIKDVRTIYNKYAFDRTKIAIDIIPKA